MNGAAEISTPVVAALAILALIAVSALVWPRSSTEGYSFTGSPLLTTAEIRFFRVLQMAVPNELVFPQVGMAAVVRPAYTEHDARFMRAYRKISQKRIDFVVCDRDSLEVRCLVELDDSSHDERRDRDRDAVTAAAGHRTVRVRAARRYDIEGLRRQVLEQPATQEKILDRA